MQQIGKMLLLAGLALALLGGLVWWLGRSGGGWPRLPGDLVFRRENFTFYLPLGTSILLSVLLTLIFYLIRRLGG